MFSATSSLVAVISRIDELDSSALDASTSTCCAMSRSAVVMSLIERAVSSLAESCVPTPSPKRRSRSSSTCTASPISAAARFSVCVSCSTASANRFSSSWMRRVVAAEAPCGMPAASPRAARRTDFGEGVDGEARAHCHSPHRGRPTIHPTTPTMPA